MWRACKGVHTLFTGQREKERERYIKRDRERGRDKERDRKRVRDRKREEGRKRCRIWLFLILRGMTGASAPFSY